MSKYHLFPGIIFLGVTAVSAQNPDSTQKTFGIRQTYGPLLDRSDYPQIRGRIRNYKWKDIEPSNNTWNWQQFDSDLISNEDGLPILLMVFTKEDSPDWLYTSAGVPKVIEYNSNNDSVGFSPYYPDPTYKFYFERMIDTVANHIKAFPDNVKKWLSIQACLGEEGDYIGYRNSDGSHSSGDTLSIHVDPRYALNREQLSALFKEYTWYYYNRYVGTNISFMCNASSASSKTQSNIAWVIDSLPGANIKYTVLGKGYQMNDELDKIPWLTPVLNSKHNGVYMRSRSDLGYYDVATGLWAMHPPRNMFGLFISMIYWGMDWSDQMPTSIRNTVYTPAFDFFNKYAGEKDTSTAAHAMCALRDGLDASDSMRFPSRVYGQASRNNIQRYLNIQNQFASKGALLVDPYHAAVTENSTCYVSGTNDVGWRIVPGNYDRYLHQINASTTSIGYWNVSAANDINSVYGRFARGFDVATGKNTLYFDADDGFLNHTVLSGQYPVMISVTYLDSGKGSWQLFYDAVDSANKPSIAVSCTNSGLWKTASVTLTDAYFRNRNNNASDFYIRSTNNTNVIFTLVELERPNPFVSNVGLTVSDSLAFDTVCVNTTSVAKSFALKGAFLNSSNVIVGPFRGYKFSCFADSAFSDSLVISNYGTTFEKTIYVKFNPTDPGTYNDGCIISGGGVDAAALTLTGTAVNSSPLLSANVNNVSCYLAKDGAVDLVTNGGIGPFVYTWVSTGNFTDSDQDISNLSPSTYTVTVSSYAGCTTSVSYVITQPNVLSMILTQDSMICKGGTTIVHVTALGGTQPYSGVGDFRVNFGKHTFTVTDAHGCSRTASIFVSNGTVVTPLKPGPITGALADVTGLCGGGNFSYAIDPVANATSYTWKPPAGCTISSVSKNGTQIVLNVPPGFAVDTLSVTANNVCGISIPQTKMLYATPGRPGPVVGPSTVAPSQKAIVYTTTKVTGLKYTWAVPNSVKIVSGQGSSSITANWGTKSGTVSVKTNNICGTSVNSSSLSVTVGTLSAAEQETQFVSSKHESVTLQPNPAENTAYILFTAADVHGYTVMLSDLSGKLLMQKTGVAIKGNNMINIDVRNYANGLYIITFVNDNGEITRIKLLKD